MSQHQRIVFTLAAVFALMLAEARRSRANERRLRAEGAAEPADDVYPWMQVLYPLAFLVPAAEGWITAPRHDGLWPAGLAVFGAGKAIKYWAIATLAGRWSFRVLVVPGRALIDGGPYRYLRHPNYLGVAGEIAGAALLCGAPWTGALFTTAFSALMRRRIRVEERAHEAALR